MTDPAVEAAERACTKHGFGDIRSAREALRPIREEYRELAQESGRPDDDRSIGMWRVLDAFAPLIFTSEELEQ